MSRWNDDPNDYEHAILIINELRGICEIARQVRAVQKKYFKTRDRNVLVESKQLERKLDEALK